MEALAIHVPNGWGVLTFRVYQESGRLVCEPHLSGKLDEPPRQWLRTMRAGLRQIEADAKAAGCHEIRIAGRNWVRIFPDYQPFDGPRNGLRKVLAHG